MSELLYPPAERKAHDFAELWLNRIAEILAWIGGITLISLVLMSLVSIVSRKLGFQPVNGDVEVMQMGCAVAAAAFIPLCTLRGDHLRVEFFTDKCRPALKRRLDAIGDLLIASVFCLLAWRTGFQALDGRTTGEISALIGFPIWIAVAGLVPSLVMTVLCGAYRTWVEFAVMQENPS